MDEEIKRAVATAFTLAGLIDQDILPLVDTSSVTVKDGVVSGIDELVEKTVRAKPKWFKKWDELSRDDFAKRERQLLDSIADRVRGATQERLPEIRVHGLDEREHSALEKYVRGHANESDIVVLKAVAKRQGAA